MKNVRLFIAVKEPAQFHSDLAPAYLSAIRRDDAYDFDFSIGWNGFVGRAVFGPAVWNLQVLDVVLEHEKAHKLDDIRGDVHVVFISALNEMPSWEDQQEMIHGLMHVILPEPQVTMHLPLQYDSPATESATLPNESFDLQGYSIQVPELEGSDMGLGDWIKRNKQRQIN